MSKLIKKFKKQIKFLNKRTTRKIKQEKENILQLLKADRLYLQSGLTLKELSRISLIHYNQLSYIFNSHFKMSFNDFINSFRIEEAKRILSSKEGKNKRILDIAFDVGFSSKSAFNAAFKKFTKTTPNKYKKILKI